METITGQKRKQFFCHWGVRTRSADLKANTLKLTGSRRGKEKNGSMRSRQSWDDNNGRARREKTGTTDAIRQNPILKTGKGEGPRSAENRVNSICRRVEFCTR